MKFPLEQSKAIQEQLNIIREAEEAVRNLALEITGAENPHNYWRLVLRDPQDFAMLVRICGPLIPGVLE